MMSPCSTQPYALTVNLSVLPSTPPPLPHLAYTNGNTLHLLHRDQVLLLPPQPLLHLPHQDPQQQRPRGIMSQNPNCQHWTQKRQPSVNTSVISLKSFMWPLGLLQLG